MAQVSHSLGLHVLSGPLCSRSHTTWTMTDRLSCVPTGALQIESSEESDQGKYECVATNAAGTRYSAPANLYVRGKDLATAGSVTLEPNFTCQALLLGDLADTGGTPQASPFLPTSFCSSAHRHQLRSSRWAGC